MADDHVEVDRELAYNGWLGRVGKERVEVTDQTAGWDQRHIERLAKAGKVDGLVPVVQANGDRIVHLMPEWPSLEDRLSAGATWQETAAVVAGASRAAHEGHLAGLAHAGLSPQDVLVDESSVAVARMGLGKGRTLPLNRRRWAAPDVLAGGPGSARADVYSLGKVLDHGLSGKRELTPPALLDVVDRATRLDPAQRPVSAAALADEIEIAMATADSAPVAAYGLATLGSAAGVAAAVQTLGAKRGSGSSGTILAIDPSATSASSTGEGTTSAGNGDSRAVSGAAVAGVAGVGAVGAAGIAATNNLADAASSETTASAPDAESNLASSGVDDVSEVSPAAGIAGAAAAGAAASDSTAAPSTAAPSAAAGGGASSGAASGSDAATAGSGLGGIGIAATRPTPYPQDSGAGRRRGLVGAGVALLGLGAIGYAATRGDTDAASGDEIAAEVVETTMIDDPATTFAESPASDGTASDGTASDSTASETTLAESAVTATSAPVTTEASVTTQAPTTQAPTTQAPTTQAPTTQAPTTQAPTTQAPTTQAPTTTEVVSTEPGLLLQQDDLAAAAALDVADAEQNFEILQAVPGLTADVYIDDQLVATAVEPGKVLSPIPLGSFDRLSLYPAVEDAPSSATERSDDAVLVVDELPTEAGVIVVAPAEGGVDAHSFASDLESVAPGEARLSINNASASGQSVISVDGDPVSGVIESGTSQPLTLEPGTHEITLSLSDGAVLLTETIDVPEGQLTSAFFTSAPGEEEDSLDGIALSVRRVAGLQTPPTVIPSGTGGLADDSTPGLVLVATAIGLLSAAGAWVQRRFAR